MRSRFLVLISFLQFVPPAAVAQVPKLVSEGVYSTAQADRGKPLYSQQCALCHGAELSGGNEAPPLTGERFLAKWQSRPLNDLFENIRATMPADRPGTLGRPETADLLALMLAANHFPAGRQPLSSDSPALKLIGFKTLPTANAAGSLESTHELARVEGRPIETLPPEKRDNKPAFAEQTRAPFHATRPYRITTLVDKMPAPWSLAFLPSDGILLTHRLPGSLRMLDSQGKLSEPIAGIAALASPAAKGVGMLDVVLDPHYSTNHRIFFTFFDYIDGTNTNTIVASATLDEVRLSLTDAKVIFRALPTFPSKRLGGKTGGRIAIAPDGTLFVSIGDRSDSPPWAVAQDLNSHLGKILHITADGAPAPDNPFLGKPGVLPEIWAYGVRNSEGLAFDPATGRLWENEHGPRGGDELNLIEKGKNYGWPVIAHGIDYPGNAIGAGITHQDGMEEPVYYWDPVIAPSGLAFYTGTLFPEWKGSVFVGGLRARMLDRLTIKNDKVVAEEPLLLELGARIRDVRVGPDGAVYVLTDSGSAGISPNTPLTSKLVKLTPR